jgi:hypothetical protein
MLSIILFLTFITAPIYAGKIASHYLVEYGESTNIHWVEDDWVNNETKSILRLNDTTVTVHKGGIYLIYAFITFYDLSRMSGINVKISDVDKVKCIVTEQLRGDLKDYPASHGVFHQCTLTFVTKLKKYDTIYFDNYHARNIVNNTGLAYWGMIKI